MSHTKAKVSVFAGLATANYSPKEKPRRSGAKRDKLDGPRCDSSCSRSMTHGALIAGQEVMRHPAPAWALLNRICASTWTMGAMHL